MEKQFASAGTVKWCIRRFFGGILIILGIIGLFLPFLQGIAMIFAGVALFGGRPMVRKVWRVVMRFSGYWRQIWR